MTAKEAIQTIEAAKAEVEWNYPLDYAAAFEAAIKALEKRIPKKPINCSDRDWYLCPNCLRTIKKRIEDSDHDVKFCPFCGQALDWSDIE